MYLQDPHGKVPFYWGIAADGTVAFSDDAKLLKQGCGKSFAPFPQGIYLSVVTDFSNTFWGHFLGVELLFYRTF